MQQCNTKHHNSCMAKKNLGSICERDVDMVIMREFRANRDFAELFLRQTEINGGYEIVSIKNSVRDYNLGETDVEIIIKAGNKRFALLIEDKIDAPEQHRQYQRYFERGEAKKKMGEVEGYYVFMTAAKSYFTVHDKYHYKVAFEDMLDIVAEDLSKDVLTKAIAKKSADTSGGQATHIVLARVIDRKRFDKGFRYNYLTLDFDNFEPCYIDRLPVSFEDAHRRLWDYIKQLRGDDFNRTIPSEILAYINTNRKYNKKNSQFIEGEGYADVAWVDCGDSLYVMYRELDN